MRTLATACVALILGCTATCALAITPVRDDGRAHGGYSRFVVSIDPANEGVNLVRRLDYNVFDQRANVLVDGIAAGEWFDAGYGAGWKDSTFAIPSALTAGKTSITVKVVFLSSSGYDWNEFHYWVDSIVGGVPTLTDSLDVGEAGSEAAHNYVISNQTWRGARGMYYFYQDPAHVITDDGRSTRSWVQFNAAIDPANDGIRLTRRLDYGAADQKADVFIDGVQAGQWFTPGSKYATFIDHTFPVPAALTTGKTVITVRIVYVSSGLDWSEFYYWVDSFIAGTPVRTDELDVGKTASEAAHGYVIDEPIWSSTRTRRSFLLGDLNCDGTVSFKDINPFVVYLSAFSAWQTLYPACPVEHGDTNGDDIYPSFRDINPFVALLTAPG